MNDNRPSHYPTDAERRYLLALNNLNIGANGRWFILALVAISISAGLLKIAVVLAAIIGVSVIAEQMDAPWRQIAAYAVYAWAAIMAIVLLVIV